MTWIIIDDLMTLSIIFRNHLSKQRNGTKYKYTTYIATLSLDAILDLEF